MRDELIEVPDLPPDRAWQEHAACGDPDLVETFAGALDRDASPRSDRAALAVCARCPVLIDCHEYAEINDERFGIWGGLRRG